MNSLNNCFFILMALFSFKTLAELPADYDKDYPYYLKFCAASQWIPKGKIEQAGVPTGHTVVYLKGACLTQQKNRLPLLHLCDEEKTDLTSREAGVGISTDGAFKNTIFSAFSSYSVMFNGGLSSNEVYNLERQESMIENYNKQGYFDGIELNPDPAILGVEAAKQYKALSKAIKNARDDEARDRAYQLRNKFVGEWMIGTEFAMNLARDLYCINIPVKREVMGRVISKLNEANNALANSVGTCWRGEQKPSNDFCYSVVHNNCDHTGHNAVASCGAVEPIPVDYPLSSQIFHLAVPGESLLAIFSSTLEHKLNVNDFFNNPLQREIILKHSWAALGSGILMEVIPFHLPNEIFEDSKSLDKSKNPFMSVSTLPTLIARYLPYPNNHLWSYALDFEAAKLRDLMKNPDYAYLGDKESLRKHYLYMEKRLNNLLKQIVSIKAAEAFSEKEEEYQEFILKFEELLNKEQKILKSKLMS